MALALRAAAKGRPNPNPHVGAVITKNRELISVGYHARCGLAHAEVDAIAKAGKRARGSTLYVTFEPCNHYGRTGPCSEAIIAAGIKRVVVGCLDPAPHKPGSIAKLRAAGIEVETGVLEKRAKQLVADFAKVMLEKIPYVILKAALTLDGRMASRSGESKWITGEAARREAHRLRAKSDAVLVGVGTVFADDPRLTVREVKGRDPIRVILDTELQIPATAKLLAHRSRAPTLVFHAMDVDPSRIAKLRLPGVELVSAPRDGRDGLNIRAVLTELARRNVVRLLVEGGPRIHGAFLDQGLVDRVELFVAPLILGDPGARPLADGESRRTLQEAYQLQEVRVRRVGNDIWISGEIARDR